ncbi:RNA-binding domain-containing protein [Natronosalvus caseinilyticus]|uniref:RNA-binding domain-containing protein n=1 Tax=Natronosalvus caseinilyticus TaxID=2953747 RepID=UPI0028AB621D|nr:RNA-binding domain-containing protein [Natronosalvus caseinilyticus]
MRIEQETKRLVKRFASEPGVESEEFDCKSKEIVESSDGRKKLVKVLSAMANQAGGTVIIGVRKEQSDSLLIQGFPVDSEVVQYITQTALEYTTPPVSDLVDVNFVEYSGKRLLRIDVDKAREKPIQFKEKGDYVPWIRVGDGMDEMSSDQLLSFFQVRKREEYSLFSSEIEQRVSINVDLDSQDNVPSLRSPSNWLITTSEGPSMFVFGEPGLTHDFGKSVLYHVEEYVHASSAEEIEEVFNILEQTTDTSLLPSRLGYAIKLGDRQVVGRGHRWFVEDLEKIDQTIRLLEESHTEEPQSDNVPSDPRPIAVAYVSCSAGIFWIETQWRGDHFSRTKCGFVFTDIPFDSSGYQSFFRELGKHPDVYQQRRGLQMLTISGDSQHLGHPEVVNISSHPDAPEYMVVDNPLYHRIDELQNQARVNIPEYISNPLNGLNRIPLEIVGGYTESNDRMVELDSLTVFSKGLLMNTMFVSGWCR